MLMIASLPLSFYPSHSFTSNGAFFLSWVPPAAPRGACATIAKVNVVQKERQQWHSDALARHAGALNGPLNRPIAVIWIPTQKYELDPLAVVSANVP